MGPVSIIAGTIARNQAITHDSGCGNTDLFLFDGTNASGNYICFTGSGDTHLTNFCHTYMWPQGCVNTWAGHVLSFSPGNETGQVFQYPTGCNQYFSAWGNVGNVSSACVPYIDGVSLVN
jgi:hypothetical protein